MNSPRATTTQPEQARILKGVKVKGEVSGAEDLYIDGDVEGRITLGEHALSIGPNGRVEAVSIDAGQVVVHGSVTGNITAKRVELKSTARVVGDVSTERIIMEDGAYLKGGVDVHKPSPKQEARQESAAAAAVSSQAALVPGPQPEYAHAAGEQKKV